MKSIFISLADATMTPWRTTACRICNFNSRLAVMFVLLGLTGLLAAPSAYGQAGAIRFQFNQIRLTVPVNTTNVNLLGINPNTNNDVIFANFVAPDQSFTNHVTNAVFSITGLPTNASAVFMDNNGNLLPSTTQSTNLFIQLFTTNIGEGGGFTFYLHADGEDDAGNLLSNRFPFVVQSAHVWKGSGYGASSFKVSNNWSQVASWSGGVPTSASDVVFTDYGGQTNVIGNLGIFFTNVGISANVTLSSLRFAQSVNTNNNPPAGITNGFAHVIALDPGVTLSVLGSNGFSIYRDYISEFGYTPDAGLTVDITGMNGTLFVSNAAATFGVNVGKGTAPFLILSNLGTLVTYVSSLGFSDYKILPNYGDMNIGYNGGHDTNQYNGHPGQLWNNIYLAKTNIITGLFADPYNYTNDGSRQYSLMVQNNESSGNGSGTGTFFLLGVSNMFYLDSVCFVGASSASGNSANNGVRFGQAKSWAIFRGTNGGRMPVFTVSDDGGSTNGAGSNVKGVVDFSGLTNYCDILADRFYVARDRTFINSNQSPNVQGNVTIGFGNVDINTAVLGFQEHSNKTDWNSVTGPYRYPGAYLNYCIGSLTLTNGGTTVGLGNGLGCTFRVNNTMYLGYTADQNSSGSSQLYKTAGSVAIYSNATMIANQIICDGGLNYYDINQRQNNISINQGGNLIVSNSIGYPSDGGIFGFADPRGMRLDNLTMTAGKLTVNVSAAQDSVYTRSISTPGTIPSILKVASLSGVTSYPAQIPVISYEGTASPFMTADISALNGGPTTYYGYVINNTANSSIDLYISTNSPNNLIWTGAQNNNWDTTSTNWVLAGTGTVTNFTLGDLVTFNDSSTVTAVNIPNNVVPGQIGVGVTISNSASRYSFSGAGTIAGTALVVKQGTNSVEFDAPEQGPINITAGAVTNLASSGGFGAVTMWAGTSLYFNGTINGGLTTTGAVTVAGMLIGPVSIQGTNVFENDGLINTLQGNNISMGSGTYFTNAPGATVNYGNASVGSGSSAWDVPWTATMVNMGTVNLWQNRMTVEGSLFGTGTIRDPNNGGYDLTGAVGLLRINGPGVMSAGAALTGVVSTMNLPTRLDWESDPATASVGFGTLRVDVDFSNPQTNDIYNCDRWNNDTGFLLMTNINPTSGVFSNGQVFTIFVNSSGLPTNFIDTAGFCPNVQPFTPGPGLVWGTTNFNVYGTLAVTTNNMIWDGMGSSSWSTNVPADTSWKGARLFQNELGAFFGDNASGSTTINLANVVSPTGIAGTPITNNATIFPGVTVSNATKNYVIAGTGGIAGTTSLYKTGPGTLTLLTTNNYIGNTILELGTLVVSNYGGSVNLLALGITGSGQMKNTVLFEGGTLSYVGLTNCVLAQLTHIEPNGATINVASLTNALTLGKGLEGLGPLTKTGLGNLVLNSVSLVYGGNVTVNGGTLRPAAVNALGTNSLILNNNTALEETNVNLNVTNTLNLPGTGIGINLLGTGAGFPATNTAIFSGPWLGAGSVTFSNNSVQCVFDATLSNFNGTISFGGTSANYQFNNTTNKPGQGNSCLGSAAAAFDLGAGANTLSNLNGAGLTYFLGSLAGGANTILGGRDTNSAVSTNSCIYNIGGNNGSTTFAGKIADGFGAGATVSVIKSGTGTWTLTGNSTFTGGMTNMNGTLSGTGSIASAFMELGGSTLAPGIGNANGAFAISNNATLGGAVVMKLNQQNLAKANDSIFVTGTLNGTGGALTVTNLGTTITNGAIFRLFNKAVTFTTVTLPTNGIGGAYVWNNNLAVDGSISLVSHGVVTVNTNPTNITATVSGTTLTLSWPADHTGWRLLAQTNPQSIGLYTNWVTVPGSTSVNTYNATLDPNNPTVFYKLVYP